jgi:opacity protein-like surface antigen
VKTSALLFLLLASPALAGDWNLAVGTGPFVFGNFAEKKSTLSNGEQTITVHSSISAATRAGVSAEVERAYNQRFSTRLGATFTRSPISVKSKSSSDDPSSEGVNLDVGDLNVATIAVTALMRFNRGGSFRPYIAAGPSYALYNMEEGDNDTPPLFTGTRGRFGAVAGVGLEWWWKENIGVRAELSDIYTQRLLKRSDFSGTPQSLELERPHNVHTVFSLVYAF